METAIFDKTRLNLKFMKLLYPQKKFSLNANLVRYRPPSVTSGIRSVRYVTTPYILSRIHPVMHTSSHAYTLSCIHPLAHTSCHAYVHSCIHPLIHSPSHAYSLPHITGDTPSKHLLNPPSPLHTPTHPSTLSL